MILVFVWLTWFGSWEESYAMASCKRLLIFMIAFLSFSRRYFLCDIDRLKRLSSSLRRFSDSVMMCSQRSLSRSSTPSRETVSYLIFKSLLGFVKKIFEGVRQTARRRGSKQAVEMCLFERVVISHYGSYDNL